MRAVAVLAVVLFHMHESWLPGGFTGVDIFFVISGYLITSDIATRLAQKRFSLLDFFTRRVKRIIPALMCVIIATLAVGHFLMVPDHLQELAWSAVASMLSAANIFFTYGVDGGYFAEDSSTRPLLHIWSLGVEEQFYLIWPIVLDAAWALLSKRQLQLAVTGLVLAGIVLSEWLARTTPEFAYYMLPARAFELLMGAWLALTPKAISAVRGNNLVALLGAGLLAFGVVAVDPSGVFPGVAAIPATLGATLLIATGAGGSTAVSRVLSLAPFVRIGKISYSLYLWHWPVLAFMRYVYIETTPATMFVAAALMLGLSVASYRYVEVPCRKSSLPTRLIFARMLLLPGAAVGAM
ncbi:acyltransferase family protein, partial [Rhizobiaceae sp. 2RAB30]